MAQAEGAPDAAGAVAVSVGVGSGPSPSAPLGSRPNVYVLRAGPEQDSAHEGRHAPVPPPPSPSPLRPLFPLVKRRGPRLRLETFQRG